MIGHNGEEIEFFNNDNEKVTNRPEGGTKFTLKHDPYVGECCMVDKFYIIHTDADGTEIARWDAMSDSVTYIKWKAKVIEFTTN